MSSFNCVYCGVAILDSKNGYTTFCEHYPDGRPTAMTLDRDIDWVASTYLAELDRKKIDEKQALRQEN